MNSRQRSRTRSTSRSWRSPTIPDSPRRLPRRRSRHRDDHGSPAKANEQVERAAAVVRRLRDFIQLGRGECSVVSIDHVIQQAQSVIQTDCEHQGIVLNAQIARELPQFTGDSLQIQQVILNLVRNAMEAILEAGRHDGKIAIRAEMDLPGFLKVCVSDNGRAFDPALSDQAVAPFATTKA